jgi:SAM-dependent methyltransferase
MSSDTGSGYHQAYGEAFARVYNANWTFFAERMAPKLVEFFSQAKQMAERKKSVLDVCCGTGQLAHAFLDAGFDVIGIDLSPFMLEHARENNAQAVADGRARFMVADASSFTIEGQVSFATSLFDSLNHLRDLNALRGCFTSVYGALSSPGLFVFDLNTPSGLLRWNAINVQDREDLTVITRGIYAQGAEKAFTSVTGFTKRADGTYDRFEEVAYNTVFPLAEVATLLAEVGFTSTYIASGESLEETVEEPDALGRAFFVCAKM